VITKKGYIVLDPSTGNTVDLCESGGTLYANMITYKDSWVVVNGNNACVFDKYCKLIEGSEFPIQAMDEKHFIVSMLAKDHYLIVMRGTRIDIYNLLDGSLIQEFVMEKGDICRELTDNSNRIIVIADVTKKDLSKLMQLRLVPFEEKIRSLIAEGKIQEASKVFEQNNVPSDNQYEGKKKEFELEAAWGLFIALDLSKAFGYFANTNYDPLELLALIPYPDSKFKTIKELVEKKKIENKDAVINKAIETIIKLAELKRKSLSSTYDFYKDSKKIVAFIYSFTPINDYFKHRKATLDEVMDELETSLIKHYVSANDLAAIQRFFENTKALKCDFKRTEKYLKDNQSIPSQTCLAYLYDLYGKKDEALEQWRLLINDNMVTKIACKQIANLLINFPIEKISLFKIIDILMQHDKKETLRVLKELDHKEITEDDIIGYLGDNDELKEEYVEYIVMKENTVEKFHTMLGLHYVNKIDIEGYKKKFNDFLKKSNKYNAAEVLLSINNMGMIDEEVFLYSRQKMHDKALNLLIGLGKEKLDFSRAEVYCLEQSECLLDLLLSKVLQLYRELQIQYDSMEKDKGVSLSALKLKTELDELQKKMHVYEHYCKEYLKKYADNEKLNIELAIRMLPDDWLVNEEENSLAQAISFALNDRLSKANTCIIEKSVAEMERLNLQYEVICLNKAYTIVTEERKCKVCFKSLNDTKPIYVFPNGVVVHKGCAKEPTLCPLTNYNFANDINYFE